MTRDPVPSDDPTLPEPVRAFLRGGGHLERICLSRDGEWSHEGDAISNPRLRALFHRSVERTAGGTWILRIPPFVYPIEVADTPFHVRSLRVVPDGDTETVWLRLSDDSEEALLPATLAYDAQRGLSCAVKQGRYRARFNRAAFHALVEHLDEAPSGVPRLRLGRAWHPVAREP